MKLKEKHAAPNFKLVSTDGNLFELYTQEVIVFPCQLTKSQQNLFFLFLYLIYSKDFEIVIL